MAVTVYGVSPSMGETEWAIYHRIATRGAWHEVVDTASDFVVSAAAGTRTVSVSAGDMAVCGTLVRSSTSTNVTFAANGGGNSRIDTVVLEVDWSGTTTTAGTLKVVQGQASASPVAPNLSRSAGTVFQVALADVTIAPSAGTLVAGNITRRTPQMRQSYVYQSTVNTVTVTGAGRQELAQVNVTDPGWPYRVRLDAVVGFVNVAGAGYGIITGIVNGSDLTSGRAGSQNQADATLNPKFSGNLNGTSTVRLVCERSGMTNDLVSVPGRSGFLVTVVPN